MRNVGQPGCGLPRSAARELSSTGGSVLILALWSLFFLGVLALAVGSYVSAELALVAGLSDDLAGSYLARAAIERAIVEVQCDTNDWDALDESWASPLLCESVELDAGRFALSRRPVPASGASRSEHGLIDEESRIHLGRANQKVLEALLQIVAEVDQQQARAIAVSIVDWRDSDNSALTDGAEDEYYRSLEHSYACHNAAFDSLHELLLVKGMNSTILHRLRPHITLFGSGLVNINTAGDSVLLALARGGASQDDAVCQSLVDRIVRQRAAGRVFKSRTEMVDWRESGRMTAGQLAAFSRMSAMLDVQSSCFGGTAAGWCGDDRRSAARIAFVYDRRIQAKVYWYEF